MTETGGGYSMAQFIADTRATLASGGVTESNLQAIGEHLRRLAATPDVRGQTDLASLHGSESVAAILHSEGSDDLTLMLAKFTDKAATPVHDHGTWAVACVMEGRDRYIAWQRHDDGADPERADVRVVSERELGPGEVAYWFGPPGDVHSQQGIDGPVWELVLFGNDTTIRPRHYFDPETGAVRVAMPM